MEYSPEELRKFHLKDTWTPEEILALIEVVDNTDYIHGVPFPYYVQTRADKIRWASCVRIAAQSSGEAVASPLVQQSARVMFNDHETYPD